MASDHVSPLQYMSGFGNEFATETLPGALPVGRNNPQKAPYGLYAEQLSGTAFTLARHLNRRSWLYRIRPAALHGPFEASAAGARWLNRYDEVPTPPDPLRWDPLPMPGEQASTDFIDGMVTMGETQAAESTSTLPTGPCRTAISTNADGRASTLRRPYRQPTRPDRLDLRTHELG
ncbi:Homogentisate 1,2-dioxygenase [Castellaniella defragrans]